SAAAAANAAAQRAPPSSIQRRNVQRAASTVRTPRMSELAIDAALTRPGETLAAQTAAQAASVPNRRRAAPSRASSKSVPIGVDTARAVRSVLAYELPW